jgi:hypothetical protein
LLPTIPLLLPFTENALMLNVRAGELGTALVAAIVDDAAIVAVDVDPPPFDDDDDGGKGDDAAASLALAAAINAFITLPDGAVDRRLIFNDVRRLIRLGDSFASFDVVDVVNDDDTAAAINDAIAPTMPPPALEVIEDDGDNPTTGVAILTSTLTKGKKRTRTCKEAIA